MSHIASVKLKLKDLSVLAEVCRELQVPCDIGQQDVQLYSGKIQAAACLRLKGWRYGVAVLPDGTVNFDNYGGAWGATGDLHRVLRRYSERVTTRQAQRLGARVRREERADGSIVLRLLA
jgi:hypothetical protein